MERLAGSNLTEQIFDVCVCTESEADAEVDKDCTLGRIINAEISANFLENLHLVAFGCAESIAAHRLSLLLCYTLRFYP
jgi:hypothetical protein